MGSRTPNPENLAKFHHYRGRVAGLTRTRSPDDPELLAAKIAMLAFSKAPDRVEELTSALRQVVATGGPLTAAERHQVMLAISAAGSQHDA